MDFDIGLVKALISVGKPLRVPGVPSRVPVEVNHNGRAIIIKYGEHVWQTEALAMKLVHARTNVPVPQLYAYLSEEFEGKRRTRCGYIIMEKMGGVTLRSIIDTLDAPGVETIANDLAVYIRELRVLDNQGWGMTGKNGFFHGGHFAYAMGACSIKSTKEFVEYFARAATILKQSDEELPNSEVADIDLTRPPVFSHGDLLPDNIMCDPKSNRITAIIDWEHAGCYPYFWDIFVAEQMTAPNWKAIYSASMEDCGRAAANFSWYYSMSDVYGTFELPDAR